MTDHLPPAGEAAPRATCPTCGIRFVRTHGPHGEGVSIEPPPAVLQSNIPSLDTAFEQLLEAIAQRDLLVYRMLRDFKTRQVYEIELLRKGIGVPARAKEIE